MSNKPKTGVDALAQIKAKHAAAADERKHDTRLRKMNAHPDRWPLLEAFAFTFEYENKWSGEEWKCIYTLRECARKRLRFSETTEEEARALLAARKVKDKS